MEIYKITAEWDKKYYGCNNPVSLFTTYSTYRFNNRTVGTGIEIYLANLEELMELENIVEYQIEKEVKNEYLKYIKAPLLALAFLMKKGKYEGVILWFSLSSNGSYEVEEFDDRFCNKQYFVWEEDEYYYTITYLKHTLNPIYIKLFNLSIDEVIDKVECAIDSIDTYPEDDTVLYSTLYSEKLTIEGIGYEVKREKVKGKGFTEYKEWEVIEI